MATNKNTAPEVTAPEVTAPEVTAAESVGMNAPVRDAQIRAENKAASDAIRNEERVEIYIERGAANDEPNLFVSVNGYNCLLPKGKTSLVPKSVAAEIQRARRAQQKLDETMEAMREAAAKQPVV